MERRSVLKSVASTALALSGSTLSSLALAQQGKKILVIASGQDIPNFDPHVATGYSSSWLLRNVYDGLVRVEGRPPKVVPRLASTVVGDRVLGDAVYPRPKALRLEPRA